jgi:hypothetical protein
MHAVINHLHLDIPVEQLRAGVESGLLPLIRQLHGFRAFYYVREAEDRAAAIILWDTAEDAQNGAAIIGPGWFAQNVGPHLASEQVRTVGEVLVAATAP